VHIDVAIAHYFLESYSDKCRRRVGNFAPFLPLNWLPSQHPLRYQKKKVGLIIGNSIPTRRNKDCENRSSRSRDTSAPSEEVRYNTQLVAMATSIEELEKLEQFENIHANTFHLVKKNPENRSSRY